MKHIRLVTRWTKLVKENKTTKYQIQQDKNYDVISLFIMLDMKI